MVADKNNRVMAEEKDDGVLVSFFYYDTWKEQVPYDIDDLIDYLESELEEEKALEGLEKYSEQIEEEYNSVLQDYTKGELEEYVESEESFMVTYDPPGFYELKTNEAEIEKVGEDKYKLHFASRGKGWLNLNSEDIKEIE